MKYFAWLLVVSIGISGCSRSAPDTSSKPSSKPESVASTETPTSKPESVAATETPAPQPESVASTESPAPEPDADGWYSLFNGKDLSGWKSSIDNPDTIRVVDGEIVVHGPRCHLYYVGQVNNANFKNFEWKCEVLTKPQANSGMYFHTQYQAEGWPDTGIEVQVNNSHGDPIKTGSLYRVANVMNDSPAKDDEWFTQHVIVDGRHVIVKVNDKVVNDYVEADPPVREPDWTKHILASGTFALQGHDPNSEVHYRKVLVKPLP